MFIPRIGQEVVVDFVNGDPDRPLITGRVYHGHNMPPYNLPANKTQSGLKTQSTPGGGANNFNELRFEDLKSNEEIYLQAEKDWNIHTKNDKTQFVGRHEKLTVQMMRDKVVGVSQTESIGSHKTITVGMNHFETIGINYTKNVGNNAMLDVGKSRFEKIGKDHTEEVKVNSTVRIGKDSTIEIGEDSSTTVKKRTVINSGESITFKCGKSSIILKKDGKIQISGKDIFIKGTGEIKFKAKKIGEN